MLFEVKLVFAEKLPILAASLFTLCLVVCFSYYLFKVPPPSKAQSALIGQLLHAKARDTHCVSTSALPFYFQATAVLKALLRAATV